MAWGMFGKIMTWQETTLIWAATIGTATAVLVESLANNLYLDAPLYYYLSCESSALLYPELPHGIHDDSAFQVAALVAFTFYQKTPPSSLDTCLLDLQPYAPS